MIKDKRLFSLKCASMSRPQRAPRADNRLSALLDEAARLFGAQGFHGTSIRDIVRSVPMLPGSVYYHFATKDLLLAAVYEEGVRRILELETEIEDLQAQIDALREKAAKEVEATHRQYRRDLASGATAGLSP